MSEQLRKGEEMPPIDDFSTGPHEKPLVSGQIDDVQQSGSMVGGTRRTRFGPGKGPGEDAGFRGAPFHFKVGSGFCEVVCPARGQYGLEIFYGMKSGPGLPLDLSQAQGLQIAVQAYTGTRGGALAVELRSGDSGGALFNAPLQVRDATGKFIIPLRFDDPSVFTPQLGVKPANRANITALHFIFTVNESIAMNSFDVI